MFLRVVFFVCFWLKRDLLYKPFFCLPWESFRNECGHTREFLGMGSKKMLTSVAWSVQPKGSLLGHWTPEQRWKVWEFTEIQGEVGFRHLWEEDLPCLGKYEIEGIFSDCQNLSAPSWQLGWWTYEVSLSFNLGQRAGSSARKKHSSPTTREWL